MVTKVFWMFGARLPVPILEAQWNRFDGWHMGPGMMGRWGGGWFGLFLWAVFWILILIVVVLAVKRLLHNAGRRERRPGGDDRALEILKERYARGEIDREQFEAMKRDIAD
jgi:putative membrane protein